MPHRPADLPREPYRALAVFLALPLITAAVGARHGMRGAPASAHAEASLVGAGLVVAPPAPAARARSHPRPPAAR